MHSHSADSVCEATFTVLHDSKNIVYYPWIFFLAIVKKKFLIRLVVRSTSLTELFWKVILYLRFLLTI